MKQKKQPLTLEDLYGPLAISDAEYVSLLSQSLNPRGPDMLYDKLGALGLTSAHQVLDIGCRDARHACELARRFHCRVLGVDPIRHHMQLARAQINAQGQWQRVDVVAGYIEHIPAHDGAFDFVWCRDMLNHLEHLRAGFSECARVLKPGGRMLVYHTFSTELLEPQEAMRLYPPLAVVSVNMSVGYFENACQEMGFRIVERDVIGSEWRERLEEDGSRYTSQQLLRIARLRRDQARLVETLGWKTFEAELADCYWGVYQMLGKLCPMVYVLQKC